MSRNREAETDNGELMSKEKERLTVTDTKLLHSGLHPKDYQGATTVPIYMSSAFSHETAEDLEAVFHNKKAGFAYSRIGNPTVNDFERKMALLEGGMSATACASGSAAVALSLLTILKSGDEILAPAGLYGGTLDLFRDLEAFGIHTRYIKPFTEKTVGKNITKQTKVVFAEIIANPGLSVVDVKAVARVVHEKGLPFFVDATTVTPAVLKPILLGADIVIHSSTKYINGNSNGISGVIVDGATYNWDNEKFEVLGEYKKFKKAAFSARLRNTIWRDIGGCLSPFQAFLNLEGLETLGLRMKKANENAQKLAGYFQTASYVEEVNYPGLKSHPDYELVQRQFQDGAGGAILTIRLQSKQRAYQFLNALKIPLLASNIGDVKTLVVHPASTIFAHSSYEEKEAAGVFDDLIRISVGIEDVEDLIEDFEAASKILQ